MTDDEIVQIEDNVNGVIKAAWPVYTEVLTLAQARSISGLRAVFGETYPDPVRVVAMGPVESFETILSTPADPKWNDFSIELCGGTHVRSTTEIGSLVVMVETNISKGIRRIVAVTGETAERAIQAAQAIESRINTLSEGLKEAISEARVNPTETALTSLDTAIKAATKEVDEANIPAVKKSQLQKRVSILRKEVGDALKVVRAVIITRFIDNLVESISNLMNENEVKSECPVIIKRVDEIESRAALLPTLHKLVKDLNDRAFLLYAVDPVSGRIFYHAASSSKSIDSSAILRTFSAQMIGAKCGGTHAMAQGSAPIPETDWEIVALESVNKMNMHLN